jgi:hypothetical protein
MSEPPEIEKLAEQFFALWQQQLAAVAADDTLAETTMRLAGMFSAGAAAMGNVAEYARKSGGIGPDDQPADSGKSGAGAARPAAGDAASLDHGGELDELRRRVADLEERLARLEAGT